MDDINSTILLIGGSLIGVVVLHGLWVAWRSRKEPLRFDLAEIADDGDDHDELALLRGELPNGGARVVEADEAEPARLDASPEPSAAIDATIAAEDGTDDEPVVATAEALEEDIELTNHSIEGHSTEPMTAQAMTAEAVTEEEAAPSMLAEGRVEPVLGRFPLESADADASASTSDEMAADDDDLVVFRTASEDSLNASDATDVAVADPEARSGRDTANEDSVDPDPDQDQDLGQDQEGRLPITQRPSQATFDIDSKLAQEISLAPGKGRRLRFNFGGPARRTSRGDRPEPVKKTSKIERDFIAMWVTARHGGNLQGNDLIEALSRNGMRYTESQVFCRLDPQDGSEQFQFVNGIEPGTFDIKSIDSLETPRVLFLLTLPGPSNAIAALEDMVEVARDVAMALGADLLDDRRSAISGQTIEHYRNRISDFTRRSLSRRSETN